MAQAQYDQIFGRLDGLAAELLASPEYQQVEVLDRRSGRLLYLSGLSWPYP
jgi:hypothetical protein